MGDLSQDICADCGRDHPSLEDCCHYSWMPGYEKEEIDMPAVPKLSFVMETGKLDANYTIPIILNCPSCGERHIDEQEFLEIPHHTHACQGCGLVWRPAKVNTHGVRFLPGYTNKD